MRSLENATIKPADKGSSIVVWDRLDYLAEAEKQLSDSKAYKEVQWSAKDQKKLVKKSNSMFEELKKKTVLTEKEKNYFKFNFKKAANVGKLYLLPKIHNFYELWYPYKKSFGILRSSFAASNERREVVHKSWFS